MDIIVGLILIIIICILACLYVGWLLISTRLKILFGYKLYEYTKILSHGMSVKKEWHKTDEKALQRWKHFEFVEMIRPDHKRLRPNENRR